MLRNLAVKLGEKNILLQVRQRSGKLRVRRVQPPIPPHLSKRVLPFWEAKVEELGPERLESKKGPQMMVMDEKAGAVVSRGQHDDGRQ